jgi:threonine aldolase
VAGDDHPRGFASDNFSGAHPEVLAAVAAANEGHTPAYGGDPWTARADECFRREFGDEAFAFPVFTGTGANVLAMRAAARPFEAAICAETAHLHADECGAPEAVAGIKLLPVSTPDGKLTPELVASGIVGVGDEHSVQPRIVSISNSTELGTVHTAAETRALADLAHERGLLLHVDGARIANAAASAGASLAELTTDAGVDLLSFGGTKNGLLGGEALVVLRRELAEGLEFLRMQSMQLASKMRFVSAQLVALLEGDLWLRNARHANAMAERLADAVRGVEGLELSQPRQANAVFARLARPAIDELRRGLPGELPFYVWDERRDEVRWMCSWDTAPEDVDRFAAAVARAVERAVDADHPTKRADAL